ncbi:MAG: GGDEF domain-containing protein [Candidatus Eremiobacteraeota bacterium]|nr:GGDEF domain-containing protein [Candidatus Eremiobacteraeota bacterium]
MSAWVPAVVAAVVSAAVAARYYVSAKRSNGLLKALRRRESDVLEAARIVTAASRESSVAVLRALHAALVSLQPAIDAVWFYRREAEELVCIYAGGARTEHYYGTRLRIDGDKTLLARAALERRTIELEAGTPPINPTDRQAVAIPMEDAQQLQGVLYASAPTVHAAIDREALVRCVAHATAPYALALDREADRMNATYDALTGLYSPRAFRETLKEHISLARLTDRATVSLWFIDTDHFKQVNDTLGHRTGDAVLQQMAALLREHTVAGVDVAARNGGDEFCAIVQGTQKTVAIERAGAFCDAVRAYDFGVGLSISASIGVASYPYDGNTAESLLEAADAAMYHSKRSGRDCVSFAIEGDFAVYR